MEPADAPNPSNHLSDAKDPRDDFDEAELDTYITDDGHLIPDIVNGIHSTDSKVRLEATIKVRRLLQKRPDEGAQPVVDSGLLGPVVDMLSSDDLEFRAEAAWILTNVASGTSEQASAVVAAGAIPKLVALFPCESMDAMDNALWALGNIGGDCQRLRDLVIQEGGVKPVLDILDAPEKYTPKSVDTASWTLTCYLIPGRDDDLGYGVTRHMIPVLIKFIRNNTDPNFEPLTNALKALDYISNNEAAAEAIIATGIAPRLVELCMAPKDDLRYHAVRCVGQFTAGSDESTDAAIQAGFLTALKSCIPSKHVGTRQNACWAASNIAAGTLPQAQALFDNGLIPLVVNVVSNQAEEEKPRNEASWVLAALAKKGREHHALLDSLVQANCVEAFCSGLSSPDYNTLSVLIEGTEIVVGQQWSGQKEALERFKAAGGVARLVKIKDGSETRRTYVGRTAMGILRCHFQEFAKYPRV